MKYLILSLTFVLSCGEGPQGPRGYRGSTGKTGEQGPQGDQGNKGKDRGTWYNGFGSPENAIGDDNDLYIDDESGDYYRKVGDVWIKQGNLEGPKGDPGEKGEQGEEGIKGEKGDKGDHGESNSLDYEIVCEDTLPGNASYKFWYYVGVFDSGDVFASAQLFNDEDEYGGGSRFYHSSQAVYDTAPITLYFDKQQNDTWGKYSIGASRTSLDYVVKYEDGTDPNENYTVSSKCVKTSF